MSQEKGTLVGKKERGSFRERRPPKMTLRASSWHHEGKKGNQEEEASCAGISQRRRSLCCTVSYAKEDVIAIPKTEFPSQRRRVSGGSMSRTRLERKEDYWKDEPQGASDGRTHTTDRSAQKVLCSSFDEDDFHDALMETQILMKDQSVANVEKDGKNVPDSMGYEDVLVDKSTSLRPSERISGNESEKTVETTTTMYKFENVSSRDSNGTKDSTTSIAEETEEQELTVTNLDTGEKFHIREFAQPLHELERTIPHNSTTLPARSLGDVSCSTASSFRMFYQPHSSHASSVCSTNSTNNSFDQQKERFCFSQSSKNTPNTHLPMRTQRQVLKVHSGPVWVIAFNHSGCFMASAGHNALVYLWEVHGNASVDVIIQPEPLRMFQGHTKDIVGLTWSKKDYLLSASLDQTVRLWHVHESNCLAYFQHTKCVTSVVFHPWESSMFFTSSLDGRLRVWDITDGRVREWAPLNRPITALAISSDGATLAAGLTLGEVVFFKTAGLKYYTEIQCKNQRGVFKKGTKVTGLQFMHQDEAILVTTNDSRIRIFDTKTFTQVAKFKGSINESMLIRASLSFDEEHLMCGSENGCIYLWDVEPSYKSQHSRKSQKAKTNDSYTKFSTPSSSTPVIVTVTSFFHRSILEKRYPFEASTNKIDLKLIVTGGHDGLIKVVEVLENT